MFKFKFRKEHHHHLLIAGAILALLVGGTIYLFGEFLFFSNLLAANTDSLRLNTSDDYYQTAPNDPLITITPGVADQITAPIINGADPVLGTVAAKINIVQFSRWDCSFCQQQENVLRQALNKYSQDVKLIHKDYPEKNITAISYQAAVAARCAAEQGKFWEYGAELYKHSQKLSLVNLTEAVSNLQLDSRKFQDCLTSGRARQLVNDNLDEGDSLEITGVPFVYINRQKVSGEITAEELDRMINAELKK